jgi:23S rRNA (cytidine2498-2'-O)-methyltransferase
MATLSNLMPTPAAQFLFMTCQPGAEGALKQELARSDPALRLSFSRPGFVTLKNAAESPCDAIELASRHWVFARTHGISLGRLTGTQTATLVDELWRHEEVRSLIDRHRLADVHVWQREPATTDERAIVSCVTPLAEEVERAVRSAAPDVCESLRKSRTRRRATPRNGYVLDVVLVEPHEWWFGYHRAASVTQRWPGGAIPVVMPDHAVSRAYAKMEEALSWSGLPIAAGDRCAEIGCAPGGASQALLDHGLMVTGIDPADVDESVLAHASFRHVHKRGRDVRRREFVGVRWLAADMNIAPADTLETVETIVTHPDVSIRGLIVTLKLADWNDALQLPEFAQRVRDWGYRDVRMRQLTTGGQEVCLVALRRRALRRLGRNRKKLPRRQPAAKPAPKGPNG